MMQQTFAMTLYAFGVRVVVVSIHVRLSWLQLPWGVNLGKWIK